MSDSDEDSAIDYTAAVELYKKIRTDEIKGDITESQQTEIDKECEIIEKRETIRQDTVHEPTEIIVDDGKIITGPPVLTRFEKARIVGARALQLSLGAPSFIEIPKNETTSLQIAIEELTKKLIPIVIRRILPNGDFQNIPIDHFK
jgi:DNA-directed RNA polymerase I, II, and III subunit RPABC2